MKYLILALGVGLVFAMNSQVAAAATHKSSHKTSARKSTAAKQNAATAVQKKDSSEDLQTDVKFGDNVLHGQYQIPEEALAKVENEKALSDLIGVRKHFKDRLQTASEQE